MRARLFVGAIGIVSLLACAIREPPPGGPADTKPPGVVASDPEHGSAGVSPLAAITIEFDEGITRTRMERFVEFRPRVIVRKIRWGKNAMTVIPDEPLHPDTTYIFRLNPGFTDAHGVRSKEGYRFAFATSASIDSGEVSGQITFRRKPSEKGVVRLFRLPRDTSFAPEAAAPDRQVRVGAEGNYRFENLPLDHRFLLWAFEDTNDDGSFDGESEAGATLSSVTLTDTAWASSGQDIDIVDPREPAEVSGTIINSSGVDSLAISVAMHELSDTMPPTHYGSCDPEGNFLLAGVLQGRYVLWGFLDLLADSLCGSYPCPDDTTKSCIEPCRQYPDTIVVEPGQKIKLEELELGPSEGTAE